MTAPVLPYPPAPLPTQYVQGSPNNAISEVNAAINAIIAALGTDPAGGQESLTARLAAIQSEAAYHAGDGVEKLAILLARSGLITYSQGADDLTLGGLTMGHPVIRRSHDLVMNGLTLGGLSMGEPELTQTVPFAPPTWIAWAPVYSGPSPVRDVSPGPYTEVSFSGWLRHDGPWSDLIDSTLIMLTGTTYSNDVIAVTLGYVHPGLALPGHIVYTEVEDRGSPSYAYTAYALPVDGLWHHYGITKNAFYIDGVAQTPAYSDGSASPVIGGTVDAESLAFTNYGVSPIQAADIRVWTMASNVQAQAVYGSSLLNNATNEIVGAWRIGDGTGAVEAFDRSVKAAPLDVVTGMTWDGVKDSRLLVVGWDTGMYVSPHTGDNWALPVATGEWGCCAMDKTGQYMLSGAGIDFPGELKVSSDYGATWVTRNPGGGDPNRDWVNGCAISGDASIMLATDADTLYKSTDHGTNWTTVNPGGTGQFGGSCANDDGSVLAVARGGSLWVSVNGGTSWVSRGAAGGTTTRVKMSDDGSVIVWGYPGSTDIHVSTDYGATWTTYSQPVLHTGVHGITCNSDGSSIAAGGGYRLVISHDGGATWTERRPVGDTNHIWAGLTMSADGKTITAFNYDTKGYRSFDGGENWTEITPTGAPGGGFYDAAGSRT